MSYWTTGDTITQTKANNGSMWKLIDEEILSSDSAQVDFTSISTDWNTFRILVMTSSDTTSDYQLNMRFNDDSGSNYEYSVYISNGSNISSSSGATSIQIADDMLQASSNNHDGFAEIIINNLSASHEKNGIMNGVNSASATSNLRNLGAFTWKNTSSKITKISFIPSSDNIASGSVITLYGRE